MLHRLLFIFAVFALLLTSCGGGEIRGSGVLESQSFELEPFTSVEVSDAFDVLVEVGASQEIEISSDNNVVDELLVEVTNGVLTVGLREGSSVVDPTLDATIFVEELVSASVSGRSSLWIDGAFGPDQRYTASGASELVVAATANVLSVEATGESEIQLLGETQTLSVTASGASYIESDLVGVEAAVVEISGASRAELEAAAIVAGSVSGASTLAVPGTAAVQVDIDDSSTLDNN